MSTVDPAQLRHLAELAQLRPSEAELDRLGDDLNTILDYVAKLETLDTSGVEPATQPYPPAAHRTPSATVWREDEPEPGLTPEEALANAPQRLGDAFGVPEVIES